MNLRFFSVMAKAPEAAQDELNAFCAQHRVVSLDKHFVAQGGESFWAVCVTYAPGAGRPSAQPEGKRERVDYREVLGEQDFAVYAQLRNLRKTLAEQEGIPPYALFTNEQLAEMVTRRARTLAALAEIEGVGKARLEKYGAVFLNLLEQALADRRNSMPGEPQGCHESAGRAGVPPASGQDGRAP